MRRALWFYRLATICSRISRWLARRQLEALYAAERALGLHRKVDPDSAVDIAALPVLSQAQMPLQAAAAELWVRDRSRWETLRLLGRQPEARA